VSQSSRCSDLLSPFPHGTLHEQPGRAVWAASVGCVRCPPLPSYPTSSICNPSSFKPFALFPHDTLHKQPWRAALVTLVGALVVSSRLVLLVIRLSWTLRRPALLLFSAPWVSLYLSRWASIFFLSFFRYDLCGHPFVHIRPRRPRNCLGWRSLECFSRPPPPPSPSDDLKPPRIVVGWAAFGRCLWHRRARCWVKCHRGRSCCP